MAEDGATPTVEQRLQALERRALYSWLARFGVIGAVAVAAVVAAVSFANAHGGDPTRVHSCVSTGTGAIRITNPSTSPSGTGLDRACTGSETATDWAIAGATGPPGISGWELVRSTRVCGNPLASCSHDVMCSPGKRVLGGGGRGFSNPPPPGVQVIISNSFPFSDNTWTATVTAVPATVVDGLGLDVYATCAIVQ